MASVAFLEKAYLAYFGRPLDTSATIAYGNTTEAVVMTAFSTSAESKALYPTFGLAQINAIYNMLFGRDAELAGANNYLASLQDGRETQASVAMAILNGAQNADKTNVANKLVASAAFTAALNDTAKALGYAGDAAAASARAFLSTVTTKAADGTAIAAAIVNAAGTSVVAVNVNSNLTVGQDTLTGTAIADTFKAMVVQNSAGSQTNQLATGDQINGGAGVDTLTATVQMAAALGGGATQAITPITTSVEKAMFTALTVNQAALGTAEAVVINAKSMTGLTSVGSVQSDASLTIQNLTTLTDTGVYADRRNTESVTIRMDHAGNDKALDAESNLTVLFDNDYLVAGKTATSSIGYWVEDREAAKATPATPLKKIDANGVVFTINGSTAITVTIPADALATFLATDGTWTGYTALLQTALTVLKTGTPAVGTTAAVAADVRLANVNFSLDTSNLRVLGKDATTLPVPAPAITLTSSTGDKLVAGGFTTKQQFGITYDVFTEIASGTASQSNLPVTSNIELLKVGRGAEGGNLTVGAMSTDLTNSINWAPTSALKQGVEVFNISVDGDATQFSSLASLQSTNNTLKVVNVVNKAGSLADLIIGNHNTAAGTAALKDVQTFNAAGFANNLTLNANVTQQSIAKYMNLKDGAPALAAADNVAFVYTGGAGNDTLNVKIDTAVAASRSTHISGLEDFTFKIDGGAGNDKITVTMVDAATPGSAQNWYNNQDLNNNFTVNGGAGNDTIRTPGAGDMNINGDAGDDTIYTDNTGAQKGQWVFNTADQVTATAAQRAIADLRSDVNNTSNMFGTKLAVTFKGLTTAVPVAVSSAGYKTTDLELNQAIKTAINTDAVLSKLLEAKDGPANTLVVTSLIDGVMTTADLSFVVTAPAVATLSAAEIAAAGVAYGVVGEAAVLAAIAATIAANAAKADYTTALTNDGAADITGAASISTSDNLVTGGAGNDVIVLGTTDDTLTITGSSNETLVFGANFGADTVLNFGSLTGADSIDFTAIGGTVIGAATTDKAIVVGGPIVVPTGSTAEAQVALLFNAANAALQTHVYVAVAGTVGTVYSVVDQIGVNTATATREGTINLAGANWAGVSFAKASSVVGGPNDGALPAGPALPTQVPVGGVNVSFDAAAANNVFNINAITTFTYNIANFATGDVLAFTPAGNTASVTNTNPADGIVDVAYSINGQTVTIHLTGIPAASDALIGGVTSFKGVFGPGSIA